MTRAIPTISVFEYLRYLLVQVLPYYLRGVFRRNRFWVGVFDRLDIDRRAFKFFKRLRHKYHSAYLFLPRHRALLVLDREGIERVLERSPHVYADPRGKHRGMSYFQPGAVAISRGREWEHRRRFNEAVLGADQPVHPYADAFLKVIKGEIEAQLTAAGSTVNWLWFERVFERMTLQIVLGPQAAEDHDIARRLERLMRQANRLFALRRTRAYDQFTTQLKSYIDAAQPGAQPGSLLGMFHAVSHDEQTRVASQVTHWLFAMKDTLAENVARAVALIAARREVQQRVRDEITQHGTRSAGSIDAMRYLGGCFQEAMRLWPSVPVITRQSLCADVLGGHVIPASTRVFIFNTFNHCDRGGDAFNPTFWLGCDGDSPFNHFGRGGQRCAGSHLALWIGKAVMAVLFATNRFSLVAPCALDDNPLPHALNHYRVGLRRAAIHPTGDTGGGVDEQMAHS